MNTNIFERREHKREKMILYIVMGISILMIITFSILLYLHIKKQPLVKYPKYTLSSTDWTSNSVVITILNDDNKISSYSFDGGKNYQDINTYEVTENGEYYITVKDINDRESKTVPVAINIIDKQAPIMTFETNTTIEVGTRFSLRNGVTVYDNESGLSSNYVTVPSEIDTSIPGEYIVKYTAFDKVGNYTEKERKVVVTSVSGTTYYRYREGTIESYQCDSYLCNCVVTKSAQLTQTCPSGYTFNNPDQCCQTCYKTCTKVNWGEWSKWSTEKITSTATREVETKIE